MLLQLGRFPRVRLGHVPTPLAIGGYKTGKPEHLVADALSEGADTLITLGAIQSNHARQTAAAELAADEVRRAGGRAGLLAYEPASAA